LPLARQNVTLRVGLGARQPVGSAALATGWRGWILAVFAHYMHKRMYNMLLVDNPAMRTFNLSLRSSSPFILFRKQYGDQNKAMRLWWVAGILSWLASLFSLIAWITLKVYPFLYG
jgi:hypothetical protein